MNVIRVLVGVGGVITYYLKNITHSDHETSRHSEV